MIGNILTTYYLLAFVLLILIGIFGDGRNGTVNLVAGLNVLVLVIVGLGHSIYLIWS